jgi:hypothetical protein
MGHWKPPSVKLLKTVRMKTRPIDRGFAYVKMEDGSVWRLDLPYVLYKARVMGVSPAEIMEPETFLPGYYGKYRPYRTTA